MKLQTQSIRTLKMLICEFTRKRNDMSNNGKYIGAMMGGSRRCVGGSGRI